MGLVSNNGAAAFVGNRLDAATSGRFGSVIGQGAAVAIGKLAHALHVALGFRIRRHAAVAVHGAFAGVVGRGDQGQVEL